MNLNKIKRTLLTSTLGLAVLLGVSAAANAQTYRSYRDYQKAQERMAREQAREQRREMRRYYRDNNGYYRDQYGNRVIVGTNGYYRDSLGNVYDRYGQVVYSSGNRVVTYPNTYTTTYNNRYVYTPGVTGYYRIYNNGSYYNTDYRGYEMLRSAVNSGYQQGYIEGQRDRMQGKRYDYADEDSYRYGNYGYTSYVDSGQYQYYYREGFRRGYEDGFYSTTRYGYRSGNTAYLLGNILNSIINLANQ